MQGGRAAVGHLVGDGWEVMSSLLSRCTKRKGGPTGCMLHFTHFLFFPQPLRSFARGAGTGRQSSQGPALIYLPY